MTDQQKSDAIAQLEQTMRACGILEFSGEAQLLEWAKSTSRDGPKIKLLLPDDDAVAPFEVATIRKGKQAGQLYHIFAVRIDEPSRPVAVTPAPEPVKREPNELARKLMATGYFRNPELWIKLHKAGVYTMQEHKKYVESLPCCANKILGHEVCDGDIVLHHCKTASARVGGPEIQPESPQKVLHGYGVPLCQNYHHMNWAHGDASAGERLRLHDYAVELMAGQVKEAVKLAIGIESLAEITQEMLDEFERKVWLTT